MVQRAGDIACWVCSPYPRSSARPCGQVLSGRRTRVLRTQRSRCLESTFAVIRVLEPLRSSARAMAPK
eukprot:3978228-Lingulodinium_polyedra.AAC.1